MKPVIVTLFLIARLLASATSPTSPYYFRGPEFEKLLPFSEKQTALFKERRIRSVKQKSDDYYIYYKLNPDGRVIQESHYYYEKKKYIKVDSVFYRYNSEGKLILRKSAGHINSYDSIVYSNDSRVIYYLSYSLYETKKRQFDKDIRWELKLNKSTETQTELIQYLDSSYTTVVLDLNNNCVKQISEGMALTDSVVVIPGNSATYSINYYYKTKEDSVFRLGQSFEYMNGLLKTFTRYEKLWCHTCVVDKCYYAYDDNGNLLQMMNENTYKTRYLYTYNKNGLPLDAVSIDYDRVQLTSYYYNL